MSSDLIGLVACADTVSCSETSCVRGSSSCRGAVAGLISPSPLKRVSVTLPFSLSGSDAIEDALRAHCRRVRRTLPCRHRCGTAAASQRTRDRRAPARGKWRSEQRAQQRRDVQAVGVGIRQDADSCDSADRSMSSRAGIDAERDADVVHLLRTQESPPGRPPRYSGSCPCSGMIACSSCGRAPAWPIRPPNRPRPGRISRELGFLARYSPRACPAMQGPAPTFLRTTFFARLQAPLRLDDRELRRSDRRSPGADSARSRNSSLMTPAIRTRRDSRDDSRSLV